MFVKPDKHFKENDVVSVTDIKVNILIAVFSGKIRLAFRKST